MHGTVCHENEDTSLFSCFPIIVQLFGCIHMLCTAVWSHTHVVHTAVLWYECKSEEMEVAGRWLALVRSLCL